MLLVKTQNHASLKELRLRRFDESVLPRTLMASARTASIRRCSLDKPETDATSFQSGIFGETTSKSLFRSHLGYRSIYRTELRESRLWGQRVERLLSVACRRSRSVHTPDQGAASFNQDNK